MASSTSLRNVHIVDADHTKDEELVDIEFADTITSIRPVAEPDVEAARFLVPGLIDTHVHLGERERLVTALNSGLTTVVELGTHPDSLVEEFRADDELPTILSAGFRRLGAGKHSDRDDGLPKGIRVSDPADAERFLDWRVETA